MEAEQSIASKFKSRFPAYIAVTLIIALILFAFSFSFIATNAVNKSRVSQTEHTFEQIRNQTRTEILLSIFKNNYSISLRLLPPIAGPIYFLVTMYFTSEIFAARALNETGDKLAASLLVFLNILALMFLPQAFFFGFLEFFGYAITLSQGFYLIRSAMNSLSLKSLKPLVNELKYTFFIVILAAFVLFFAAYLESFLV